MRADIQALHVHPEGEVLSVGQMLIALKGFEDLSSRVQIAFWMLLPTKIEIEIEIIDLRYLFSSTSLGKMEEESSYCLRVGTSLCRNTLGLPTIVHSPKYAS
jgi:hypothetical protein